MSEENMEQGSNQGLESLNQTDLIGIIRGLRAENASRRVANREQESEIEEFRKWKASQESETDRLRREAEEAKTALRKSWVTSAMREFNVPAERERFLAGETIEEITEAAKLLGNSSPDGNDPDPTKDEKKDEKNPPTSDWANLFAGARGKPVGSGGKDPNEVLRNQLRN